MNNKITYAMIEPTTICNLKCKTCSREYMVNSNKLPIGSITVEKLKLIKEQLPNLKHIRFHGMGELLLLKNHLSLLKQLRELYPNAWIEIVTNGQYKETNEKDILKLTNHITFSIDAINKQDYENIRINGKWETIINNINKITKHKTNNLIELNFVWSKLNLLTLPLIVNLVIKLKIKNIRINIVQDWDSILSEDIVFNNNNKQLKNIWDETKNNANLNNIKITLMGNKDFRISDCEWMDKRIFISFDGEILPCCMRQDRDLSLGNIFKDGIDNKWDNKKNKNNLIFCKNCPYVINKKILKELI